MLTTANGRFGYVAPFLAQAKDAAWDFLKHYAQPITAGVNESELKVTLINGAFIRIHGADNPDRLRGSYLDGVVLDEYAQMRPSVWGEVIRPMLADRQGWATFIGTPKGHNSFWELMYGSMNGLAGPRGAIGNPEWYAATFRASETGILPESELADMRRTLTPDQYEQEAECSFEAAIQGAYFGKEMAEAERDGRITDVPYEPDLPVHTAWDLGKGANMAIWFWQIANNQIRIIDHWEGNHDEAIPDAVDALNAKNYTYGNDFVPHDARVPELGTGRTRVETLTRLRRKPWLVPDHRVMDGINAARISLGRCWFDARRCREGIEALKQYKADFDEKLNTFKDEPRHDWASHSADAFRYLCMAWKELVADDAPVDPIKELLKPKTWGEIWKRDDDEDAA